MFKRSVTILACIAFVYSTNAFVVDKTRQVISFPKEAHEFIFSIAKICAGNESKLIELQKIVREGRYREDDDFKNFVHCCFKNSGYSYGDGTVNIELSAPLYPDPAAMLEVMKQCDKKRGSTPVDNTFLFFKCFQKLSPFLIGL